MNQRVIELYQFTNETTDGDPADMFDLIERKFVYCFELIDFHDRYIDDLAAEKKKLKKKSKVKTRNFENWSR